jgi:phosphatidylinositol phospholipase C delta
MIFHGKTLTSKVPLREVCLAIKRYAFVASPYPIIISAEVHCSLPQQDLMAKIMKEVFGEILMSAPIDGRPKIPALPSPEDLKGRILLKVSSLASALIAMALKYVNRPKISAPQRMVVPTRIT